MKKCVVRRCFQTIAALCLGSFACMTSASAYPEANTVRVFYYSLDDIFLGQLSLALQDQALANDIHLVQYDARKNLVKQINQIKTVLSENPHSPILVNPVDLGEGVSALKEAKKYDVPIIFFNREPDWAEMRHYDKAYFVGTFANEAGSYQAEVVLDFLAHHPEADVNKDGKISYVLIKGERDHTDSIERTRQFQKKMESAGVQLELLDYAYADWSRHLANQHMDNMLDHFPDDQIELVVCNNDAMALGALTALRKHGFNIPHKEGSRVIPLVGIDALPMALEAIGEGSMIGTVFNDSESIANACMEIVQAFIEGAEVTEERVGFPIVNRIIKVPYMKITYDNIGNAQR